MSRLNSLLPIALLAALLCAGVSMALGGDILSDGVRVFAFSYVSFLPASYLVAMCLPLWRANHGLAGKGAAVVGAAAPVEYAADADARVIFRDGDAISAFYRKEITLRGDPNAARWHRMANRIFHLLGSPLAVDIPFEHDRALQNGDRLHAEIVERGPQYIKLHLIDDTPEHRATTEVMMGSHEALARRGVRLPKRSMEQVYRKSENSHVVYLAFDGHFRVAYSAEYRVSRAFKRTLAGLSDLACHPVLVSYDPMLTPGLLATTRLAALATLPIVRPDYVETVRRARSSGVMATGSPQDLLYPLTACSRIREVYRRACRLVWPILGACFAVTVCNVLYDGGSLLTSGLVALFHLVLAGVFATVSLVGVNRNTLRLRREPDPDTIPERPETADSAAGRSVARAVRKKTPKARKAPRRASSKTAEASADEPKKLIGVILKHFFATLLSRIRQWIPKRRPPRLRTPEEPIAPLPITEDERPAATDTPPAEAEASTDTQTNDTKEKIHEPK